MLIVGGDAILAGQGIDLDLLDRAVELEQLVPMSMMERPSTHRAIYIGHAGRYRESITLAEGCLATAEQEGDWAVRPHILRVLAWFEFCVDGSTGRSPATSRASHSPTSSVSTTSGCWWSAAWSRPPPVAWANRWRSARSRGPARYTTDGRRWMR
jgi:hypothetical protein